MKKIFSTAFNSMMSDYVDDIIILCFTYFASLSPHVSSVLTQIGWNPLHFYIGVSGQLTAILIMYVRGFKLDTTWYDRLLKGVASLFLGGIITMVSADFFNVENSGVLFFVGAAFQAVWDIAVDKLKTLLKGGNN